MDHAGEDALGDDFDAGCGTDAAVTSNAVANGLSQLFAKALGHALCGGAGSQAAWLEHKDFSITQPGLKNGQGHDRGFPGPRWCLQNRCICIAQSVK